MQPFCWGPLRAGWADRLLQADFLYPDAMPIRPEQSLFSQMFNPSKKSNFCKRLAEIASTKGGKSN